VDLTVRPLDPSDRDAFIAVDDASFSVRSTPEQRAQSLATTEWSTMLGAFGGGSLCGVAGSFAQRLTVPGGARVEVAGVTAVGVLPTHRRRGVLTALMGQQLDDVAASGRSLAVLTASEATIYRRFGYGLASRHQSARLDRARSTFARPVSSAWTLRLVEDDEARELAPPRFEAQAAVRVGAMTRPAGFWPGILGSTETWVGGGEHFTVVCDPPPGEDRRGGYALYKVRRDQPAGHWVTVVEEVVAADPEAEAALWRYLLDIDLTEALEIRTAPLDDPLAWRLDDWRAYQVTGQHDFLWARVLDPAAALGARSYGSADALVIEVEDRFRPRSSGRWRVAEVRPAGGSGGVSVEVDRTHQEPDLTLDVADLGSLYLGGVDASTLARAGRLRPRSVEVLGRADRFFSAERLPFCLTRF
jgi:predicted acetyltransferase